jgi:hypothetical protein
MVNDINYSGGNHHTTDKHIFLSMRDPIFRRENERYIARRRIQEMRKLGFFQTINYCWYAVNFEKVVNVG